MSDRPKVNLDLPYPANRLTFEPRYSSKVYPVEGQEDLTSAPLPEQMFLWNAPLEILRPWPNIAEQELRSVLGDYEVEEPENLISVPQVTESELKTVLVSYEAEEAENLTVAPDVQNVTLEDKLVDYEHPDAENLTVEAAVVSLELS